MPTITVQAADSATAMDKIWEQLGPDAMIVSTSKHNGHVVMEATTDSPKPALAPSSEAQFSKIFTSQMLAKPEVKAKNGTAQKGEKMSDTGLVGADIASLRRDITQMQNMLSGLVLTDLDGVNPSLLSSTRLELQRAGFSAETLNLLKERYAGLTYREGSDAFLGGMAERLAHPNAESLLSKRLIFVVGSTGTGCTTMVAKLTAMLREAHPKKEIIAASLHGQNVKSNQSLQNFGRLLKVPVCDLSLATPAADFNKMTDYDVMVIDVTAMPDEASQKISEIKAHVGAKEIGIVATIPGSTSRTMIEATMQRFADLAPTIALTKLDECETTAGEFSAYVEQGGCISILSGTKSVIGASVFASESILLQYLKENFSNHEAILPTDTDTE